MPSVQAGSARLHHSDRPLLVGHRIHVRQEVPVPMALQQGAKSGHTRRVAFLHGVERGIEFIDSLRAIGDDGYVEGFRSEECMFSSAIW